ncbi:MAG: formate--tetrahydrofolate ligase, partial [Thermoplasmata archaeon]
VVLITGITPSGHGVGKTVTTLSLGDALARRGRRSIACLRQPSLGPVFGIKGGGAGGGRATVEPQAEANLGLTGDIDAVTNAHNLLASLIDNHLHHGNRLSLDPHRILWTRAMDLEDRALREIEVGRGEGNGPVHRSSFVITPASEIMAILGVARGPTDLVERLGRIRIGVDRAGRSVSAGELGAAPAMGALLRHALRPNLLQSQEGNPVLMHGGPFGNLSYGTTTRLSIECARSVADVVLVEAGFGSDLGAEKFVDLFAPGADLQPSAAVLVASIPGLRAHAPGIEGAADRMTAGLENLEHHVRFLRSVGLDPVVALNRFPDDDPDDLHRLVARCGDLGVRIEPSHGYAEGGAGASSLAEAVEAAVAAGARAHPVYSWDQPIPTKVDAIVRAAYGGDGADFTQEAAQQATDPEWPDASRAPVCVAKTPLSLTDDPRRLGRPTGFRVTVRRLVAAAGAGYTVAYLGEIATMPGLPRAPRTDRIGLSPDGAPIGVA